MKTLSMGTFMSPLRIRKIGRLFVSFENGRKIIQQSAVDSELVAHRFESIWLKLLWEKSLRNGRVGTKGSKNDLWIGSAEIVGNKLTWSWEWQICLQKFDRMVFDKNGWNSLWKQVWTAEIGANRARLLGQKMVGFGKGLDCLFDQNRAKLPNKLKTVKKWKENMYLENRGPAQVRLWGS